MAVQKRSAIILSGGYLGQDGICIGSDFERYTFRMGTEIQVTPKVRFGGTVNVSYTKQGTGMASWSIIPNALYQAPDVPVRDKNGNFPDRKRTTSRI